MPQPQLQTSPEPAINVHRPTSATDDTTTTLTTTDNTPNLVPSTDTDTASTKTADKSEIFDTPATDSDLTSIVSRQDSPLQTSRAFDGPLFKTSTPRSSKDVKQRRIAIVEPSHRFIHSRFTPFSRSRGHKTESDRPPIVKIHIGADHRPISVLSNASDADSIPNSPDFEDLLDSTTRLGSSHSQRNKSPSPDPSSFGIDSRWASLDPGHSSQTNSTATVTASHAESPRSVNMHQTSSRLLRMTAEGTPFTRDFKDLFSTLMVSLRLKQHRVRFTKVDHTFTTAEAMLNLGSLKFSQSNRMPDPKDPLRIVTTTTTTTFSMARDMAQSVCARFLEARMVESLEGKTDFTSEKSVWQLTPKGMRVLSRFCTRNGIRQRHINQVLESPRNVLNIVILERVPDTDKLIIDRHMIEVIFRRFAGEDGPNVKSVISASENESMHENATGSVGCRCIKSKKTEHKETPFHFTGKSATDWLMDCCMVVDRRETFDIAGLFLRHGLVAPLTGDLGGEDFTPTKQAVYKFTEKGMKTAGWNSDKSAIATGEATPKVPFTRDSNNARTAAILADSSLRLLFREYLIETHCEENLTFWVDVQDFLDEYRRAKEFIPPSLDMVRETLATAYGLYNAFLAPGSPCELNIDHNLRNSLAGRMTRAFSQDTEMFNNLDEVAILFDQARTSVFKLMASDSVPKFSKDPKYSSVIRDRNLEFVLQQAQ